MDEQTDFEFRPSRHFFKVPHDITFAGAANGVAVDDSGLIRVFNRGGTPSVVSFDAAGNFVGRWGEGEFTHPHGIASAPGNRLLLVDAGAHRVELRGPDGQRLLTLEGTGAAPFSGEPFNRPTDAAMHPSSGDIFVSDGYANARIHRYDSDGKHITSWGMPGTDSGCFAVPHSLCVIDDDVIAVCDRENYRIQFFDLDGRWLEEWHQFRPSCIRVGRGPLAGMLVVAHLHPPILLWQTPDVGHSVSILDRNGHRRGHFGSGLPGHDWDQILSPHFIDVDESGNIYIAETTARVLKAIGIERPEDHELISLRRWELTTSPVLT